MPIDDRFVPTVLVADDDPAALRLVDKIVSSTGYPVLQAHDGCEAFDLVLAKQPDLVISDWEMPGMAGPALCEAIRKAGLSKYVYVILLTARTADAEMVQGLEAGADDFIVKPIKPAILRARLRAGARVLAMERRLLEFSQRDPLTDVLNRRTFHERFSQEWDRACRHDTPLSCVMVDLDFFKKINDIHGHAVGDAVLRTAATVLQDLCRTSDVICRYGGEEFCVVLPETDEAGGASWAERARLALAQASIPAKQNAVRITGSLGVAQRLADTKSPDALVDLADRALAVAKQSGRNRVVAYSSLLDSATDMYDNPALRAPLDGVAARDVMIPALLCPPEGASLAQVSDLLLGLRLASVPVVHEDGQLAGIVSEIDLARATAQGRGWNRPVREIMKPEVATFDESAPAQRVLDFLARAALQRVVIVEGKRPTGVISRASLLRWLRNWASLHPESTAGLPAEPMEVQSVERRNKIIRIVETAQERLAGLRSRIAEESVDHVPCLIAEVTRLQEMANDLLGQSSAGQEF